MRALGGGALLLLIATATAPPCRGASSEPKGDPSAAPSRTVVVGSKNFAESRLLAELAAQLIETRTELQVERRLGLAGTQVCFEALVGGAIDLYPEYTGTGLVSLLGEEAAGDATATLRRVRSEFLGRWDLHWLAPLGFENAYEIAVPEALAEARGLTTLSDLAAVSAELDAGLGFEFIGRPDGLPGLEETYGLTFKSVRPMQQALKYEAASHGEIDLLDVYTTDGRLLKYGLRVLADDRDLFPPYEAAFLVRGASLATRPELAAVLGLLAGAFDEERMRQANLRLQEGAESEAVVAGELLVELGLSTSASEGGEKRGGRRSGWRAGLWPRVRRHLWLCAAALLLGAAVAVPLALLLSRYPAWAEPLIRVVGTTQTVPSIALLAFFVPLLGVGVVPALVALWIYTLFPILRSAYTGLREADPEAIEAATAMGMTPWQILRWIQLPLATPILMAGVRTAGVLSVGTATLAAFIGAGGLGEPIVTGLQLADLELILSGAIPAAALAILVDAVLGWVERRAAPRFQAD